MDHCSDCVYVNNEEFKEPCLSCKANIDFTSGKFDATLSNFKPSNNDKATGSE